MRTAAVIAFALLAAPVRASPNVNSDDGVYITLARLRAEGRLVPFSGGVQLLTAARVHALLLAAGEPDPQFALPSGWWWEPLQRVAVVGQWSRDHARPYSTAVRPRDVTGAIDVLCEHQEGRPCGDGAGLFTELDTSAGFGPSVSGSIRLRAQTGTDAHETDLEVDRGHVDAELGPVGLEVGRDVLVLGPSRRTQLAWGDNAPPIDQLRLSTARPLDLAGVNGSALRGSLTYLLGRLRAPQTYPGNFVSITRGQLDILDSFELGMSQLLQLGGDGAPSFGVWDFVLEHLRRRDASASATDSSNRRISFDVSARIAAFAGARFYYELVFEDWRKHFADALRFDADHLAGVELAAIGPGRKHGLVIELQTTGVRSQEHTPRITGFTNAGYVVGSPLGPDATSLFAGGRIELGEVTLSPWLEIARLSSDTYTFVVDGPISLATKGVTEGRYRAATRLRVLLRPGLAVEGEALVEHVANAAFVRGATRENFGITSSLVWKP
jgi:hypothetical protein